MGKTKKSMFVLDCPVCREPGLPHQLEDGSFRLMHQNRPIATCRVKEGTDAAESIRTHFRTQFGSAYADATPEDATDEISTLTEWGATYTGNIDPYAYEALRRWVRDENSIEVDVWEGEGGACRSYEG